MIESIVETQHFVTILGPSDPRSEDVDEALRLAPVLVAADGAASHALAMGRLPDAVIGDLDSIPPDLARDLPADRLHRIDEQDTTDFEKCLVRIRAPLCLAVGFTGRRLDHELAVYSALVRHSARPCLVLGTEDVAFAAPARLALDLEPGTRVSLFPLSPLRGWSEGLRWPIGAVPFDPAGRIGTSNEATGPVALSFERPGMLVILPRATLPQAMAALAAATGASRGR
ncbi:thiamine diphosphokinase [Palleronia sp. KMU-117]|uniref:thiamine diphosphokinase n=1 Tax=Palleronia sp. KMU-117 TaxID=3434108 RepID=UPI003D757E82